MHRDSRRSVYVVLAALVCLGGSPAHAQWSGSTTTGVGGGVGATSPRATSLGQGNAALGRNAPRDRAARGSDVHPPVARRKAAELTYAPDPRITEKIRVSMIDLASASDPASRPGWEKVMADDAVLRDFDRLMAAQGYSRLNLADDVATLLAICWEIANDRKASDAQVHAIHAQTHGIVLTNPALRALPEPERQTMAETIAYQVLFMSSAKRDADRSGDSQRLAEVRESAAKAARQYGIDVAHMQLTEEGFRKP